MREKFAESWRAAGYVATGLLTDFPNSSFEVTLLYHKDRVTQICKVSQIGRVLESLCKGFPMATVYYQPEADEEPVAMIHCHCQHEKGRGCCKNGGHHRAKVLISFRAPIEESPVEAAAPANTQQ